VATVENNHFSAVDYTEATDVWDQWPAEDCDSDTGENNEAAGDSQTVIGR